MRYQVKLLRGNKVDPDVIIIRVYLHGRQLRVEGVRAYTYGKDDLAFDVKIDKTDAEGRHHFSVGTGSGKIRYTMEQIKP